MNRTKTKCVNLKLSPEAIKILEQARQRGYTKSGYASMAIVEKEDRESQNGKN